MQGGTAPIYRANGFAAGKPALEFTTASEMHTLAPLAYGHFTMFAALKLTANGTGSWAILTHRAAGGFVHFFGIAETIHDINFDAVNYSNKTYFTTGQADSVRRIWRHSSGGNHTDHLVHRAGALHAHSTQPATGNPGATTGAAQTLRIGSDPNKGGFAGQLAELLLFNALLTAQQIADVEAYMAHWTS